MFGANRPPDGWLIVDGCLGVDDRVIGYFKRRCEVTGHCYQRDCRRTVFMDYGELVKDGLGAVLMRKVKESHRCVRLSGCGLSWTERHNVDPSLGEIARRGHIAIEVRCLGRCKTQAFVTTVEAFIARLQQAGTGGADTKLRLLDEAVPGPCETCKGRHWRTRVLWYDPAVGQPHGRKVPFWKEELDRRLQEAEFRRAAEPMAPGQPPPHQISKRRA